MGKIINGIGIFMLTAIITLVVPFITNNITYHLFTYFNSGSLMVEIFFKILFYIIQVGIAIFIVKVVLKHSLSDMGFNLKNLKTTLKVLKWFLITWLALDILFYMLCLNFYPGFDTYIATYYVADGRRFTIDLVMGCIMAGSGEEPFFRGMAVLLLLSAFSKDKPISNMKLAVTAICSGILFMLAHIPYTVSPFTILNDDIIQLSITFTLGTFWAVLFMKTKSLFGPILAHTCANIIQIMSGYIVAFFILK